MAHELEFTVGEDGVQRASFFTVGETAWHREGHVLTEAPTYQEALKLAKLDYEVEKRPTFIAMPTTDGTDTYMKQSTTAFVTVRTDTGLELGAVGRDYTVVNNLPAFRVLEPLLDEGVASLATGGVLRNGGDAWLMVQWNLAKFGPVVREVFAAEVTPFGLLAVNHTGRRGILLKDTNVRVVCANTLGFAESETMHQINVRHSGDAEQRLIDAAFNMWGGIIERYETLALQYQTLKARVLTEQEFTAAVLDLIAPSPLDNPKFNPEAKLAGAVLDRALRKRAEVRRLWDEGKGHVGDHSAWEAYNAAVECIDHNAELFPTRAGSWRTASLLDGNLHRLKQRSLEHCLVLANGSTVE